MMQFHNNDNRTMEKATCDNRKNEGWRNTHKTLSIAQSGLMIAFAMIVSYIESILPFYFGAPGIKPGFANFFVVFLIIMRQYKQALFVNGCRILLTGLLFGNMFSILYSLMGALCSFLAMFLISRVTWMSIVNISMVGGVCHNMGQYAVACVVLHGTDLTYYLPVLMLAGVISGGLNGVLVRTISPHIVLYHKRMKE